MNRSDDFPTLRVDAQVRDNTAVSSGLFRLDLEITTGGDLVPLSGFQPGQFAMLNFSGAEARVFGRPFSILDWEASSVSFLYRVVGGATRTMAQLAAGDVVNILGPLGRPFPTLAEDQAAVLIGGGVGLPPVASWLARHGRPQDRGYFGARDGADVPWGELEGNWQVSVDEAVSVPEDRAAFLGRVTELVAQDPQLDDGFRRVVLACGPVPMLRAAHELAVAKGWECLVSLEEHMGCGYGACKGCVIPVKDPAEGWRNATCCDEGPVFPAGDVIWDRYAANPFALLD